MCGYRLHPGHTSLLAMSRPGGTGRCHRVSGGCRSIGATAGGLVTVSGLGIGGGCASHGTTREAAMAAFAKSGDASDAPSIRYLINLTSNYRCFGCSAPDAHAIVPAGSEGSASCQRAIGTRVASVFAALKRPDILSMHPPRRSLRGQTSLKLSGDGSGWRRSIRYKERSHPKF
jgi:hypothetical protein